MAVEKMSLKKLYSEFEVMKDKYDEEIVKLKQIIDEQKVKIDMLEKVSAFNNSRKCQKKPQNSKNVNVKDVEEVKVKILKCKVCEDKFSNFSELELHIKQKHESHEKHECGLCGKLFVTSWRLRKHASNHSRKSLMICKYYKNETFCPFEELGCKFSHEPVKSKDDSTSDCSIDFSEVIDHSSTPEKTSQKSFYTSTPKSVHCGECDNESNCTYCFVMLTLGRHGNDWKKSWSDHSSSDQ